MSATGKRIPRRVLVLGLVIVLVALLIGWTVGNLGGPASTPVPSREARPRSEAGSQRTRAGIPVAFADDPDGAAAAAAAYERAFASTRILRPAVMKARIEAVATPDYVEQMLAANTPGRERLAAGPIGKGIASGLQTLYASVPIGYEIESFTPQRARVLTWGFTLLGNASAVEPAAYFGLTHTELVWSEGSWRIAETQAGFGPTPKLATSPGPLGGYDVIDLASHLKSYALAP
jgi:hypothetical protein